MIGNMRQILLPHSPHLKTVELIFPIKNQGPRPDLSKSAIHFHLLVFPTPRIQLSVCSFVSLASNMIIALWVKNPASTLILSSLVCGYIPIVVLGFSSKVFLELTLKTDLGFPLKLQKLDIQIALHLNQSSVT